jgi:DNA replication protein DnaC
LSGRRFNLIADRYQRRAPLVSTNLALSNGWRCAGDEKLTTALLDRLAHHATAVTMKGKSYRMRNERAYGDVSCWLMRLATTCAPSKRGY